MESMIRFDEKEPIAKVIDQVLGARSQLSNVVDEIPMTRKQREDMRTVCERLWRACLDIQKLEIVDDL